MPENTNKKEPGASDMIFQINKNTGSVKRYWLAGGCPEIFERDIYLTPKSLQDMNYKQELLIGKEMIRISIYIYKLDLILYIFVLLPASCRIMI